MWAFASLVVVLLVVLVVTELWKPAPIDAKTEDGTAGMRSAPMEAKPSKEEDDAEEEGEGDVVEEVVEVPGGDAFTWEADVSETEAWSAPDKDAALKAANVTSLSTSESGRASNALPARILGLDPLIGIRPRLEKIPIGEMPVSFNDSELRSMLVSGGGRD